MGDVAHHKNIHTISSAKDKVVENPSKRDGAIVFFTNRIVRGYDSETPQDWNNMQVGAVQIYIKLPCLKM